MNLNLSTFFTSSFMQLVVVELMPRRAVGINPFISKDPLISQQYVVKYVAKGQIILKAIFVFLTSPKK